MSLIVRRVETAAERELLYAFRYRVYVQELHMTEDADHDRRWLYDALDEVGVSLAVFQGGEIVGCLRLVFMDDVDDLQPMIKKFDMGVALERFEPREITATSRFILDRELRHGKIIFRLIKAGYEAARKRGVRLNYGDCSPHQLSFYEHLGYRRYTRGYNDAAFGYKIPILMLVNDHAFLNQVRSPIARLAAESQDDREARRWFERVYPDYVDLESAAFMPEEVRELSPSYVGSGAIVSGPCTNNTPSSPATLRPAAHRFFKLTAASSPPTTSICLATAGSRLRRQSPLLHARRRRSPPDGTAPTALASIINPTRGNPHACAGARQPGNDRLFGSRGEHRLFGEAGTDHPDGELDFDRCDGGSPAKGDMATNCEQTSGVP